MGDCLGTIETLEENLQGKTEARKDGAHLVLKAVAINAENMGTAPSAAIRAKGEPEGE